MANSIVQNPKVCLLETDFFTQFELKVDEVLDKGMCGEVILAIPLAKPELRRVVKKFSLLDEENKIRSMQAFQNEVQFMQSLNHPYIVKILIAGQCKDYLAICMYYYSRGTLDNYVGILSLDLSELCISQVACALRYLHKNNIAHMDVKLDNIFLDDDFNAILGDFGLAVELQPDQKTLPKSVCGGTTCYYAPERIGSPDDKQLDPYRMDAFSLGVCMWAAMLGRDPDHDIDYYYEATQNQDLPAYIRELLLKLLDPNPGKRLTVDGFLLRLRQKGIHRHLIDSH
ncbi:unnamed protein product [Candidula unifasciata]|uniref:non-specific serine/threonine protein kinase n=1 Tax=Candidula unifasciata TaxID=100452 RepID=A0A8S3YWX3_9EUPU|nr:unnamed protein product [Candidula unifasciata]